MAYEGHDCVAKLKFRKRGPVARWLRGKTGISGAGAKSVTDAVYNQHEFWAEKPAALDLWEAELRRIAGL